MLISGLARQHGSSYADLNRSFRRVSAAGFAQAHRRRRWQLLPIPAMQGNLNQSLAAAELPELGLDGIGGVAGHGEQNKLAHAR